MDSINVGYYDQMDDMAVQVKAVAEYRGRRIYTNVIFNRDAPYLTDCGCPACDRGFRYDWYPRKSSNCAFVAAALAYAQKYMQQKEVGDATDKWGAMLLAGFQRNHTNQLLASAVSQGETIDLVPRLFRTEEGLRLSFKVGSGKLYVIKDLIEFCAQVRDSETVQ